MKEPSGRIIRWVNALSEYDFDLMHRAGKLNVVADSKSRNALAAVALEQEITHDTIMEFLNGKLNESSQELRRKSKNFMLLNNNVHGQGLYTVSKWVAARDDICNIDLVYGIHGSRWY